MQARLPDYRLAVELRNPKWFEGDACEGTLEGLEACGLALVCIDGPAGGPQASPGVAAATADVAVVRFVGRREVEGEAWTTPYRYSEDELRDWVPRLTQLASSALRSMSCSTTAGAPTPSTMPSSWPRSSGSRTISPAPTEP